MKLNPDCIRDILLTVEEYTGYSTFMRYPDKTEYELLKKYSEDEVFYHIDQSELSGLLTKVDWTMNPDCLIYDLSPQGHKFLADIRSDTTWNKTKEISKKVGSSSLDALKQIASGVIAELIKHQFPIH